MTLDGGYRPFRDLVKGNDPGVIHRLRQDPQPGAQYQRNHRLFNDLPGYKIRSTINFSYRDKRIHAHLNA
jgi:hypothetical protein